MKLTLATVALAMLAGIMIGGRPTTFAKVTIRWPWLAPLGLGLQVLPVPGRVLPLALLYLSFVLLFAFAVANLRVAGFALILVGLCSNFLVIAVNGGMPVTRHALIASGQQDTLSLLVHDGGAKHHLASDSDILTPLADTIPIPWGIDQAVSVGDVATYLGLMTMIIWSMRRRSRPATEHVAGPIEVARDVLA
jgi:Family of unknown function (DUF5317)